jgi:hypothetical protein
MKSINSCFHVPQMSSTGSTTLDQETSSVGSLRPTEITQPSQDISRTTESESLQNGELDHLLDPKAYYEKLDQL